MNTPNSSLDFKERSHRAITNRQLQTALAKVISHFTNERTHAISQFGPDWEKLKERANEVKKLAIDNLDYYLNQFASNVERAGGKVFWAKDAIEANEYVVKLAAERGIELAVKGKSMVTEETELNNALISAGIEAIETDLGEYIIQLAGERPSHIVGPALHKTKGDIAGLFADKLGVERTEEITQLTAIARGVLRNRFGKAGMGITGANFAVAETGTIVLVENEGNIRLSTSLPPIHVAFIGIEKILPKFTDLSVFLSLLPRNTTGQQMTAYVSLLTGVKRDHFEEGPEELHVILLDNSRTEILANTNLRESMYCIRCGACLSVCPVYSKIGGHAYGWVYPGPIGAILTPQLIGREQSADLPFASSLCSACKDVCPVKIDLPRLLLELRHEISEKLAKISDEINSDQKGKPSSISNDTIQV